MLKRYSSRILRLLKFHKIKILFFALIIFLFKLQCGGKNSYSTNIQFSDENVQTFDYVSQYEKIKDFKDIYLYNSNWKNVVPSQRKLVYNTSENIIILELTKIFGATKYCQKFDKQNFDSVRKELYLDECPFKNCIFSCDKKRLNEAGALLFHQTDLEEQIKQDENYLENLKNSFKGRRSQIWILWNDEANKVDKILDNFEFNWTMSYRIDSEVSDCSYGCMYRKMIQKSDNLFKNIKLNFKLKKNEAVWFVSNCEPKFRISFAKQLKEHFPVKVFGACSSYFEPFFKRFYSKKDKCSRDSGCEHEQLIQNKFYLSFESKNCSNYLTEKVWKMLHIGIIPVVIQPSKQFYELNLPPNSFIHAQDFNYDAQKLAKYLNYVANDFDTYYSYLKWKLEYQVVFSAFQTERRRLCELCTRLNTEDSLIYYNSVSDFFNDQCIIN